MNFWQLWRISYYTRERCKFQVVVKIYGQFGVAVSKMVEELLNMCPSSYWSLKDYFKKFDFYIRFMLAPPKFEFSPPFTIEFDKISSFNETIAGKKVLVHCRHGIGRTGTFVTSYMIRKGLGLKAVSKKLKSSGANPSNYSQWKLLKKYGKKSGVLKFRGPSLEFKNRVDLNRFFSEYESFLFRRIFTWY